MGSVGTLHRARWAALAVLALAAAGLAGAAAPAAARRGDDAAVRPGDAGPTPSGPVGDCVICHGSPEILDVEGAGPDAHVGPEVIALSVHWQLSCQDCHGALKGDFSEHPENLRARAETSCTTCHETQARLLDRGAHGPTPTPPAAGAQEGGEAPRRPGCGSCHGSHEVLLAASREFAVEAARGCSGCHTERGESYFDRNYHGKETRLGRFDVAVCSDCHGAHSVLPASDPRSPVNPANVVETCRQCHPAAPENFADIIIHVGGRPLPNDPRLMGATLAMMVILVVTFGFFGVHTALAIRHELRSRRRRGGE